MSARRGGGIRSIGAEYPARRASLKDFYQNDSTRRARWKQLDVIRISFCFVNERTPRSFGKEWSFMRSDRSGVPLARSLGTQFCILPCAIPQTWSRLLLSRDRVRIVLYHRFRNVRRTKPCDSASVEDEMISLSLFLLSRVSPGREDYRQDEDRDRRFISSFFFKSNAQQRRLNNYLAPATTSDVTSRASRRRRIINFALFLRNTSHRILARAKRAFLSTRFVRRY